MSRFAAESLLSMSAIAGIVCAANGSPPAAGKRESTAAWHLLFFALWHRTHILGLPPAGEVFETLSAS